MKRILVLLISLYIAHASLAQQRSSTLLDENRLVYNGLGGPFIELSAVGGQPLFSVGGSGAASINDRFFFGGFGQSGTARGLRADRSLYRTQLSQGGLWLGYVFRPSRVVHLVADTRLGWTYVESTGIKTPGESVQNGFVVTPSLGTEVNVTRFLRIRLTGGYRIASGFDSPQPYAISSSDVNSLVGALSFQFGQFR